MSFPRGGSSFTSDQTQPSGGFGALYTHETYSVDDILGVLIERADGTFATSFSDTATTLTNLFTASTFIQGDVIENQRTREKMVITTTSATSPVVVRAFDGTAGDTIIKNDVFKRVGIALQVNGAYPLGTETTIEVNVGQNHTLIDGGINLGWVISKEQDDANYGELMLVTADADNSGYSSLTVTRNFGKSNLTNVPADFAIADLDWLIIRSVKFDDPRKLTGVYNLRRWYQIATNGDVVIENPNEDTMLMTNEKGNTKVIQATETYNVTIPLVSYLDYMDATVDSTQIDANDDRAIGINLEKSTPRKDFAVYVESLDNDSDFGWMFYACANSAPASATINNDQRTFTLNLKTIPSPKFDGKVGVRYVNNIGD